MDETNKDVVLYIEHYGIQLGAVKAGTDEDVAISRNKLIALTGYLVAQEHMFRIEITNKLIRMTIKDNIIEVIWKIEPLFIQKFVLEHAWQGPLGLHGPVIHLKIEAKVNGNGKDEKNENPFGS